MLVIPVVDGGYPLTESALTSILSQCLA